MTLSLCRPFRQLMLPLLCQRTYAAASASSGGGVTHLFKSFRQRIRRNPRIIPHPKVKAYKVREWRQRDPEAVAVYAEQQQHYEMQMDALKQAFYYELHGRLLLPGESAVAGLHRLGSRADHLADSAEAERQIDEAERLNAEWNARSAEHRSADMLSQRDAMRDHRDRLQLDSELAEKAAVLSFQARLERDLAQSADFINASNLDEKIEAILDAPIVDFNFAVDPAGGIVGGSSGGSSSPSPPPVEPSAEPPTPEELSVRV